MERGREGGSEGARDRGSEGARERGREGEEQEQFSHQVAVWVQIPVEQVTTRIQEVLHSELKRYVDTIIRLTRLVLPEKVPCCRCGLLSIRRGRY